MQSVFMLFAEIFHDNVKLSIGAEQGITRIFEDSIYEVVTLYPIGA